MAFDSLYTGISGLDAYQSWIDMISNNIANTATTGFKAQRMTFADQFYQQVGSPSGPTQTSGGVNPIDNGTGVKVNTVDTEFGQGGLQTTGINTDLALNGDGFFIMNNASGTGSPTYTRDGAFSLNSNGLFYDPASGNAVMGYMANSAGVVNANGTPGAITIPVGLAEQAQATGTGVKSGPAINDQVFDVALGGNLDQTNWSQAFQNAVGASANPGAGVTVSTTLYDSLGGSHEATITYTPVALSAVMATVALAGGNPNISAVTVAPATSTNDVLTISPAAGNKYTVFDQDLGTTQTFAAGTTQTVNGVTFTMASPSAGAIETVNVAAARNGLPSVANAAGNMVQAATEWQVNVSFADGTQFQSITNGASIGSTGTVKAATLGQGSTGVVGFAYFDQNGQFINSSSIASVADVSGSTIPEAIGGNAPGYFHDAGATASLQQGNQLNVLQWGPSVGNAAQAPTGTATPGAIALGFYDDTSLNSSSTGTVVSQNGYGAGILSNISVGQDGTVTGSFSNGQQKTLAQLAVATFQNEDGLERIGGNQFAQTAASGLAQVGTADSGRFGSIVAGSLEESNVNLANEFTNLIVAQRAFEANSRGIQTADQNLITVTHIQASEN
jgi:flagellar hook protein FlgE